ncbi:hypothetical protein SKAU_G00238730 [Synaphobranchus kaupii]|uniref:Histamine N-methyltransferase n=1 Tax=Synaphobranchus kaupii TaxID=118154 RepID=A0A9Q1F723_SYNKA|nr:hypothetical protein SKAU_G00238730 [Synaphobranchus kaupii]
MASPFKSLLEDDRKYLKSFQLFRERSSEQQCMQNFIRLILPDILASIGNGNGCLNVMGVGSGAGNVDLEMFSQLRLKHPGVSVHNEVVEPSSEMLENYKGKSAWGKLWTFKAQRYQKTVSYFVTTSDVKSYLDAMGIKSTCYELPSQMDITECFQEGDEKGELLLDFLMEVSDFSKSAPPHLRSGLLELLRQPDCSTEVDGRVLFNNNLGVLVIEPDH